MHSATGRISYQQLLVNPTYIKASNLSSPHIIRACLNNDWLLRYHEVTFASQLRSLADNGIVFTRQAYEQLRNGKDKKVNYNWLSYLVCFWQDNYGYNFSTLELQMDNFHDIFETRIKPEADAKTAL